MKNLRPSPLLRLTLTLVLVTGYAAAQVHIIGVSWLADPSIQRASRYNRQTQNPGSACHPSPCGKNTQCMVNNQGNPICSCNPGTVPMPSPVDGCDTVEHNRNSPVILQNRLGGGHASPGYLSLNNQRSSDPCNPSPCGPGTQCSVNRDGNPECRCQPGYSPNPDTITGCKPECERDPDCRMGFVCRSYRCAKKPDPCEPNPCGPGARCSVNSAGNALCQCEAGLIPKPDTITGCGPECTRDPDCRSGQVCQNQRCVEKPDPCQPSPCGPGAECSVTRTGNAICRCQAGLIPNPDTISGCKPECTRDPDCSQGYVCQNQRCVEKPDPCQPSPCGPGAECSVTRNGNAICRCQPGLIPNPDTISGCKPECVIDPDCSQGYVCQNQRCVEKPDPCNPSPCGPGAVCTVNFGGNPICRCEPGLVPKPDTITGCGPECVRDPDCNQGYICQNQRCIVRPDPCDPSPCGPNTFCTNQGGNPICKCNSGFIPKPDTITGCDRECYTDPDCRGGYVCANYQCVERPDPCDPSPCGPNTMCMENSLGNPICRCLAGFIPMPDTITGCKRECERDPDCSAGNICQNYKCVVKPDPCDPSPCGPNTECSVLPSGNPICRCLPTYVPKPDTITGCGRECEIDRDCNGDNICQNYKCVPRPDPCQPTPCGPNTECNVNFQGNPVCTCLSGFEPQPDTITGCSKVEARTPPPDPCFPSPCGPNTQCDVNRLGNPVCKCLPGYIPQPDTITGCVEEPDPCNPNPCGPGAECLARGRQAECKCPAGFKGDPYAFCKRGDCEYDHECSSSLACFDYNCRDPCIGTCGRNANCEVQDHRPICSCPQGFTGDPLSGCDKRIVVGGRFTPARKPEPRNTIVIGQQYSEQEPEIVQARTVVGGRYTPSYEEPAARTVVGQRYNTAVVGGSGVQGRTNNYSSGGASRERGVVVVGSTGKKRKRRTIEPFTTAAKITKFFMRLH